MLIVSLFLKLCSAVKVSTYLLRKIVLPWAEKTKVNWSPHDNMWHQKTHWEDSFPVESAAYNNYLPVPDCRPVNRLTILAGIFFAQVPKSCKQLQFTDLPCELLSMMVLPEPIFTTVYSVSLCKKDAKVLWLFLPGGEGGKREGSVSSPLKYAVEEKSQSQKTGARTIILDSKWSEVAQSCLTLWDPMDCSLPGFSVHGIFQARVLGSSVHGIFQARVLEWVATSFSRGSSRLRDWTGVSHIAGGCFTL